MVVSSPIVVSSVIDASSEPDPPLPPLEVPPELPDPLLPEPLLEEPLPDPLPELPAASEFHIELPGCPASLQAIPKTGPPPKHTSAVTLCII
jgi:hypothetical protein